MLSPAIFAEAFSPIPALQPVVWFDGSQIAFSDTGSTVTGDPSGRVRQIRQRLPATGNWAASNDTNRPYKDSGAIWFDGVGHAIVSSTVSVARDNHTVWWRGRLSHVYGNIGGLMDNSTVGLFLNSTGNYRVGVLFATRPAGFASTGLQLSANVDASIIYTVSSSAITITVRQSGVSTTYVDTTSVTSGALTSWSLGPCFVGSPGIGRVYSAGAVNRQITESERNSLLAHLDTLTSNYPANCPLVVVAGDSIAFGFPAGTSGSWACKTSRALTTAGKIHRLEQTAYPGYTIAQMASEYSSVVTPLFLRGRGKNVLIVAAATNSIAFGSLTAAQVISAYWAYCDQARADGWQVVACTVLPRSDASIRGTFEADRTTFNAAIVSDWASHADALANVAAISGMGAFGDSDNATNYGDKVHCTAAGYTLLEPTYTAAASSLI